MFKWANKGVITRLLIFKRVASGRTQNAIEPLAVA